MEVRNTCLHCVGRLSWRQCLHLLSQSLQVGIMSQLHVLGLFLDRPCRLNLKEMSLLKEFGATKLGLVKVGTK